MGLSLPPCRWPFPRLRGVPSTGPAGNLSATGTEPLSSFALRRVLPSEAWPTGRRPKPENRSAPLMGFRSLRHIRDRRSTLREPCQTRCVPPTGFGYPLGGLLPPSPCRPYFVPAAPLGFSPSELPPPARCPGRYRPDGPTCRFASRCSRWRATGRTGWPRLLGFDPCERPWRLTRV
jgi:hypothetical protein